MAIIPKMKPKARFVHATCTAIEDLGYFEAHYGHVRRVKYTFETDAVTDDGAPLLVSRVFNDDMCRTASQRKALHRILGRSIPNDQVNGFDRRCVIGRICRLKLTKAVDPRFQYDIEIRRSSAKDARITKVNTTNH